MVDYTSITKAVTDFVADMTTNMPAIVTAVSGGIILMAGANGGLGLLKKFIKKVF